MSKQTAAIITIAIVASLVVVLTGLLTFTLARWLLGVFNPWDAMFQVVRVTGIVGLIYVHFDMRKRLNRAEDQIGTLAKAVVQSQLPESNSVGVELGPYRTALDTMDAGVASQNECIIAELDGWCPTCKRPARSACRANNTLVRKAPSPQ